MNKISLIWNKCPIEIKPGNNEPLARVTPFIIQIFVVEFVTTIKIWGTWVASLNLYHCVSPEPRFQYCQYITPLYLVGYLRWPFSAPICQFMGSDHKISMVGGTPEYLSELKNFIKLGPFIWNSSLYSGNVKYVVLHSESLFSAHARSPTAKISPNVRNCASVHLALKFLRYLDV